ncbi:MAG: dihydrodipicolinate synthase family protein [Rhodospirillales bacterium]|nr:dihydrodipicolinate synthase family protein [Rhodospirillales bacterium]MDE2199226.1 dihydrodipicolinate synthase family protein [Rhodospirillales bacterium]
MSDTIRGLWVAIATPLDSEGRVDPVALARHGTWLLDQGCDGLVPFGTTGEGPSFTAAERLGAVEALLRAGIDAGRIAIGAGAPAIGDTVGLVREALALGLTHALILPPFYFRDAPEDGLEDAFAAVIEGVASDRLRATLYNIPQVSGVAVSPALLGRLRARFGRTIAGVKDSTGNFDSFLALRAGAPDCAVVVGHEPHIPRVLAAGGAGTICGMANMVPGMVRALFTDPAAAEAMQAACDLLGGEMFQPAMKAVLAAQSGDAAWRAVRPPLRAASPATGARIAAALAAMQKRQAA